MIPLQTALEKTGFQTVNINYPSTHYRIETLALKYVDIALKQAQTFDPEKIHFVTHSMGALLLRYYLNQHNINKLGRIVMLSPPNQGSEIADKLSNWALYKLINGPAGLQLGTSAESLPKQLGPTQHEIGIITGDRSYNPLLSSLLTGPSDGKVTLESARLTGMSDYIIVPKSHSFIMNSKRVKQLVIEYLQTGRFHN
jgi:pimeloyl-ACP methyl ester carboxylesterase